MDTPSKAKRIGLHIEPLDNLFFRGGRPMESGSRNRSELPGPQNLLGMIRTYVWGACGCDFSRLAQKLPQSGSAPEAARDCGVPDWAASLQVRGPWLAKFKKPARELHDLFLPLPANLEPGADNYWVLHPTQLPLPGFGTAASTPKCLWNHEWARARVNPPASATGKKAEHGLMRLRALREYLGGARSIPSGTQGEHFLSPRALYALEPKVGIGLNVESLTVEKGLLFSTDLLRLNSRNCDGFYAEIHCEDPSEMARLFEKPAVLMFGGESRCVSVQTAPTLNWPKPEAGKAHFHYLLTPGFFGHGAIPDVLPGTAPVCAAAVRDTCSVSGWDLARRGPKPARFGVSAGSVYFAESPQGCEPLTSLCRESEDQAAGYGAVLSGVWNYV